MFRLRHIAGMSRPDVITIQSSEYEIRLMSTGGVGILLRYRLNRVGDRTLPCGILYSLPYLSVTRFRIPEFHVGVATSEA